MIESFLSNKIKLLLLIILLFFSPLKINNFFEELLIFFPESVEIPLVKKKFAKLLFDVVLNLLFLLFLLIDSEFSLESLILLVDVLLILLLSSKELLFEKFNSDEIFSLSKLVLFILKKLCSIIFILFIKRFSFIYNFNFCGISISFPTIL